MKAVRKELQWGARRPYQLSLLQLFSHKSEFWDAYSWVENEPAVDFTCCESATEWSGPDFGRIKIQHRPTVRRWYPLHLRDYLWPVWTCFFPLEWHSLMSRRDQHHGEFRESRTQSDNEGRCPFSTTNLNVAVTSAFARPMRLNSQVTYVKPGCQTLTRYRQDEGG